MRERMADRRARARAIVERLGEAYPEAKIALEYGDPLQLLVAVILSAQCTDKRVNLVTPALFARFPTAADFAAAEQAEVEAYIRTCGLFRAKARSIIAAARAIQGEHRGRVPESREALAQLPGVGNKTAGVVAMHLSGETALPVDTHVARLSRRLGLTSHEAPDKIERDLRALLPPEAWSKTHHVLIWHGRRTCVARSPNCEACPVAALCPKRGVRRQRQRSPGQR